MHLLVEACQRLWLHAVDGVYQQFTCVNHTTQPSPLTALSLAVSS